MKNTSAQTLSQIEKVYNRFEKGKTISVAEARRMKIRSLSGVICHMRDRGFVIKTLPVNKKTRRTSCAYGLVAVD